MPPCLADMDRQAELITLVSEGLETAGGRADLDELLAQARHADFEAGLVETFDALPHEFGHLEQGEPLTRSSGQAGEHSRFAGREMAFPLDTAKVQTATIA